MFEPDPKEIGVWCQVPAVECEGSARRSSPVFHQNFPALDGWAGWHQVRLTWHCRLTLLEGGNRQPFNWSNSIERRWQGLCTWFLGRSEGQRSAKATPWVSFGGWRRSWEEVPRSGKPTPREGKRSSSGQQGNGGWDQPLEPRSLVAGCGVLGPISSLPPVGGASTAGATRKAGRSTPALRCDLVVSCLVGRFPLLPLERQPQG